MVPKKAVRLMPRCAKYIFQAMVSVAFLVSCEEELKKKDRRNNKNFPTETILNASIIRNDSGYVNLRFRSPILEKYSLVDSPYVEAKKGIYLEYFDKKKPEIPGRIWAKYARMNELAQFYTATGDVKIITNDGQTFETQRIFWDQKNHKMFTRDTVFVTDKDGSTLVGANGLTARDDFSEFTFFNNSGTFSSKEIPSAGK